MGFLGILEDKHNDRVPGTIILDEEYAHSENITAALKHGTGKDAHIILTPQPSEDPNDPLNWTTIKKLFVMCTICFGSILYAATFGPLLNAGLFTIATEFEVPIGSITLISGYQLLVAGASGPFFSAASRKWGKKPCFMISSLFALIGTIIGSTTNNYEGLLAARVIQGAATSAYESLCITVVGDLYFVHERGFFTSVLQFLLGGISNFSSVIAGPITANLGWKYMFHILIAFISVQTILLFFCPETSYIRDRKYESNIPILDEENGKSTVSHHEGENAPSNDVKGVMTPSRTSAPPVVVKKIFWQGTAIFTGTYSDENLLQLIVAPFAVCTNIVVLWVVVMSGTIFATTVAQSFILAQVFSIPPYSLSASGVGYLSMGPFIGGIFSSVLMAFMLDPLIKWASKRNGGVYEPEYRLLAMGGSLFTGVGLMVFGYLAERGVSYYATAAVHGVVVFGLILATISSTAYALDAYRDMSNEIFIMGMLFKNFLFYAFSYFVNDWTAREGAGEVFYVFGGVALFLTLTTPVVFIFGKRYRSFWHRNNILEKIGVRTHSEF
ncbi:hypothetical protein VF21_09428 [Pseudogymnoascus sp. 05NY08]|nr:hypothetical protein VF21_09428 [Pseudogymnoascus sp. 05NY08]